MRRIIMLAATCAGLGYLQSAAAEQLRCGDVLISPGDEATYVLENCFGLQSGAHFTGYHINLPQVQRWRVIRESGQFRAVVVIGADGRVEDIQFDRRREED